MEKFWNNLKDFFWNFLSGYGLNILKALALFVLGLLIIRIVTSSVKKRSVKSRRLDNAASTFITSLVALIAYVALALVLVKTLGFSTAGIVAAFSSVMLAIALGMQDTLSSLTNGILLIFTKPFQAGDYVDIGGTNGQGNKIVLGQSRDYRQPYRHYSQQHGSRFGHHQLQQNASSSLGNPFTRIL